MKAVLLNLAVVALMLVGCSQEAPRQAAPTLASAAGQMVTARPDQVRPPRRWAFFRQPATWCLVIDRTLDDEVQESITQQVVEFHRRRLIGVNDYLGIVALGQRGELVYDAEARYLPEARGIAGKLARSSGLKGSNICAGLASACRFLANHPGTKRLLIVSDLVADPYKRGSDVIERYRPVTSFDWAAALPDLLSTEITLFGVPEAVQAELAQWLHGLAARCAILRVFGPGHRLSHADFGGTWN
ncbi:MAG: hypothetical protein HUU35_06050 [Armatimonadetes bacterium]|nr:hypothetical protein [Armatimonadota bacterium]